MSDLLSKPDFAAKASYGIRLIQYLRTNDLDGPVRLQLNIFSFIYCSHSARSDEADNFETTGKEFPRPKLFGTEAWVQAEAQQSRG